MSIDEAIQRENKIAEENQKIVDTEIVFDDVSLSQLYCDDTEVIEEHLSNYRKCAEYHEQLAEWLEELKCYKNDNDFSDYADRLHKIAFNSGYNKALDDFVNTVKATFPHDNIAICNTEVIAEQLKVGEENE